MKQDLTDLHGDSNAEDDEAYRKQKKKVAYDDRCVPGYQASYAAFEFGLKHAKKSERVNERDGARYLFSRVGDTYGEVNDKASANLEVFEDAIVVSHLSNDAGSARGYVLCPTFVATGEYVDAAGERVLRIEFRDRFARIQKLDVRRGLIAEGPGKLVPYLQANGFNVPTGKKLCEYVCLLLNDIRPPEAIRIERTGWVDDLPGLVFAFPDRLVGEVGDVRIARQSLPNLKIARRGSLKDWRVIAGYIKGNSRLALATSIACASPLLRFAPEITPPVLNVFGESSSGKTTAARMAGSFWGGGGPLGFAHTWNATPGFIVSNAAAHSDTLFVLDEFGTADNPERSVYTLVNGQERGRLDKNSKQKEGRRVRVCTFSTGELSFDEKMKLGTSRVSLFAGAEARIPSIPADAGKGQGIFDVVPKAGAAYAAQQLNEITSSNYGHAGPLFVEKLIEFIAELENDDEENPDGLPGAEVFSEIIKAEVGAFVKSLRLDPKSDAAVLRLANSFGLIAYAGKLVCDFGILQLDDDDIVGGVRRCFLDWVAARGGTRSYTTATALIALRDFIATNARRFAPVKDPDDVKTDNLAGYVEDRATGGKMFYLLNPSWKKVIETAPRAKLVEELDRLGLLVRQGSSDGHTIAKKLGDGRVVRAYAVRGEVLELRDDGTFDGVETVDNNVVPYPALSNLRKMVRGDAA